LDLHEEYKRQYQWRPWSRIFDMLPPLSGRTVLDLGCAVGDQSAQLAARGAAVIGVDANGDLLSDARSRALSGAEFLVADLAELDLDRTVDGIWCSFTAAYFPDLPPVLAAWRRHLKPGGWIALTEVDDLFGHEPMAPQTRSVLEAFAASALTAGRYDFHMGRKLRRHLERSGFVVREELKLEDRELAFGGAASSEVMDAWTTRFDRMRLLRDFCGSRFVSVRDEFLSCLARTEHQSRAQVYCCLAARDPS
jgi:SAM-dependent methyltransferase